MPLFHAFTLGLRYDWLREIGLPGDDDLHEEVGEGADHLVLLQDYERQEYQLWNFLFLHIKSSIYNS